MLANRFLTAILLLLTAAVWPCTDTSAKVPAAAATRASAKQDLPRIQVIPLDAVKEIYDQEPPHIISHYTKDSPASLRPVLRWDKVKGAVSYEVQIHRPGTTTLTARHIFVPGYNAALPAGTKGKLGWRVRALDFDRVPITAFSPEEMLYVDPDLQTPLYPEPLSKFNSGNGTVLLYPVYNWVPVTGAASYDVEILTNPNVQPDEPAAASQIMGRGVSHWFDWYDDSPRMSQGTLYWRVRARDTKGAPLGVFCPPQPMLINPDKPCFLLNSRKRHNQIKKR